MTNAEYSEIEPDYAGLSEVGVEFFRHHLRTPEECRAEIIRRIEEKNDEIFGKPGSLECLARLFPRHVNRIETYSEFGDGGWAGGGPDDWGSSIKFIGRTPAGRLAITTLETDKALRPVVAMEAAIARETGLAAVGAIRGGEIKLKGKRCGFYRRIVSGEGLKWIFWFCLKREPTENDPCKFRNALMNTTFKSEEELREYLQVNTDKILANFKIYFH